MEFMNILLYGTAIFTFIAGLAGTIKLFAKLGDKIVKNITLPIMAAIEELRVNQEKNQEEHQMITHALNIVTQDLAQNNKDTRLTMERVVRLEVDIAYGALKRAKLDGQGLEKARLEKAYCACIVAEEHGFNHELTIMCNTLKEEYEKVV